MITRWHRFSYEKQRHLHASEKLWKKTDMADPDSQILKHLLRAHLIPVFGTRDACLDIRFEIMIRFDTYYTYLSRFCPDVVPGSILRDLQDKVLRQVLLDKTQMYTR